ncbi:protein prenyltransferase alpha subunit repeat-containing protein 1-like [Physella acuta]|uniref:protein prenyltransferase alpha subunit repeat-containing protein 1-like n=1 Tax=Physella acuta TaxID=109671 RepID=UPI0027DC29C0|nr:protein prenyltransferase alpha subunit repeat-containing protein 1-like [Physella acuta]
MTIVTNNMADARAPRLLIDLNNIFRKDPNIDEYDILPVVEATHNRSPFFVENHKLGVEAWAVKLLVKYCANRLIGWRGQNSSEKCLDPVEVSHLSRAVLLFNPDNYTAWNIRKELIESGYLSIKDDLSFGVLIISKHPKSPETFIHRRWLFQQLLDHCLSSSSGSNSSSCSNVPGPNMEVTATVESIDLDLNEPTETGFFNGAFSLEASRLLKTQTHLELDVCATAAERYPCNYHAWSHRIWIVKYCLNCSLQILLKELKSTEKWTSTHISDHSGFHYRQFLLTEIHARNDRFSSLHSQNSTDLFVKEMVFVRDLIDTYPGHEALWYHRRFVFQSLLRPEHLELSARCCHLHPRNGHAPACNEVDQNFKTIKSFLAAQEIESVTTKEASCSHKYNQMYCKKFVQWIQNSFL